MNNQSYTEKTREALQNLMDITTRNLRTFLDGNGEHIVNR